MTRFELVTEWRIGSALDEVWEAISHCECWPQWWRGLSNVVEVSAGGQDGVGTLFRFSWKGVLPYHLDFDIRTTRVERLRIIEGVASGDVSGIGIWRFSREGGVTVVRYEWTVRMAAPRMKVLAWVAGPLLRWNHNKVMEWGGRGLARHLRSDQCVVQAGAPRA